MAQGNFNPPDRGKPGRLEGGGTRARNSQYGTPPNPANPNNRRAR